MLGNEFFSYARKRFKSLMLSAAQRNGLFENQGMTKEGCTLYIEIFEYFQAIISKT
jgi:hypothetical protein